MTAIQKMVSWLEQEISIKVEDPEDDGYLIATTSALRYANRLADEEAKEQAHKPTAPASLLGHDRKELDNLRDVRDINNYIIRECAYIAPKFKGVVMKDIDDLPHFTPFDIPVPDEKPAKDLQGQHAQMVALAKAHGLDIAADWAVKMSGKTFSEEKPTSSSDEQGIKTVRVVCPLKDPQRCVTCMDSGPCDGYIHVDMPSVPSQEPLIVMAYRLGFGVAYGWGEIAMSGYPHQFEIWFTDKGSRHRLHLIVGKTYAEAESKARAYLNGLTDKGEIK